MRVVGCNWCYGVTRLNFSLNKAIFAVKPFILIGVSGVTNYSSFRRIRPHLHLVS